jgi:hypothetical protein
MSSMIAGATGAGLPAGFGQQEATTRPEFYLWRQYTLRNGTAPRRLAEYFENAAIPALNRLGHSPIGVFTVFAGVPGPGVFVLTPLATLESLATLEARLDKDEQYVKSAAAYADVTAADPAYIRIESSLLSAFPRFPRVVVPAATAAKGPRLFELRTYESPSEKTHLMKVKMFSEMGEIEIFKRVGLTPVFFSRTLVGPRMPSLTYLLVYENLAARERNWTRSAATRNGRRSPRRPVFRMPRSCRTSRRFISGRLPIRRSDDSAFSLLPSPLTGDSR